MNPGPTRHTIDLRKGGKLVCRPIRQSVLLKLPEAAPRGLSEEHYAQAVAVLLFRWCVLSAEGLTNPEGGQYSLRKSNDPVLGLIAGDDLVDVIELSEIDRVVSECMPKSLTETDRGN